MTDDADDETDEAVNAPVVSHDLRAALDGMIASLRTKETAKRVAFKIPFVLGKDLSIGITGSVTFLPSYCTHGHHSRAPRTSLAHIALCTTATT